MEPKKQATEHETLLRPGRTPPGPELRALLVELADTLKVARVSVDDLVRDLTADRWPGLLPGSSFPGRPTEEAAGPIRQANRRSADETPGWGGQ
jgi:hypothetical protein